MIATFIIAATSFISLYHMGMDTFYTGVEIAGSTEDYLMDTGAGMMTITTTVLERAQEAGEATYLRQLEGHLADGQILYVPVYKLHTVYISECVLHEVEAAVFENATRGLLGLSALRQLMPFTFHENGNIEVTCNTKK